MGQTIFQWCRLGLEGMSSRDARRRKFVRWTMLTDALLSAGRGCHLARRSPTLKLPAQKVRKSRRDQKTPSTTFFGRGAKTTLLIAFFVFTSVSFGNDVVPVDKQATFLLKALSHDRNLKKRSSDSIHIAVLFLGEEEAVKTEADEVVKAFNEAGKEKVKGLTVETTGFAFQASSDLSGPIANLSKQIEEKKFNVLYIHDSLEIVLSSIQKVTHDKKIPSLGGSKKLVEQGTSLGVYLLNGKPKLVVNLKAAEAEEFSLSPAVLRLSTVIDKE